MSFTEADLDAVRDARLRGVRSIKKADGEVTYTSDAEKRQVEQDILEDISRSSTTRKRQFFGVGSKGF